MIITLGICHGLVETRFKYKIPEKLEIKAYTEDIVLTWFCLHSLHSYILMCRDMDTVEHLITFMFQLVTNICFYLFTCYFREKDHG